MWVVLAAVHGRVGMGQGEEWVEKGVEGMSMEGFSGPIHPIT